jgi:hypothetical protein
MASFRGGITIAQAHCVAASVFSRQRGREHVTFRLSLPQVLAMKPRSGCRRQPAGYYVYVPDFLRGV